MSLHVLSYNVHWGLSAFKRVDVSSALSTFIHKSQADVVLLQELWLPRGALEYVIVDALKEVWPHQVCAATALLPSGAQGNGILSRHPLLEWKCIDISYSKQQPRSFLHARLEVEARTVSILCTHLGLSRGERKFQAQKICDYVSREIPPDEALVLGGDFNDWRGDMSAYFRDHAGLIEVFQQTTGRHARSFPAIYPLLGLDRLYMRGLAIEGAEVLGRKAWRGSSDHLALAARLSF